MPTDNNDCFRFHVDDNHITANDDDYHQPIVYLDDPCADDDCEYKHVFVLFTSEYRELVAAARDRHPTNQQRRPDPTSRTAYIDDYCDLDD